LTGNKFPKGGDRLSEQPDIDLKSETTNGARAKYTLEKFNGDHGKEENVVESLGKRENHEAKRGDITHEDEEGKRSGKDGRKGYLQGMAGAISANGGELIGRCDSAGFIQGEFGDR
jgi:hypothetical protein